MNRKLNLILFILLACFWSGSFIGIKIVVAVWPPLLGAAIRVAIGLICLMLFIRATGKAIHLPYSLRWKVWMIGLFAQAIPFTFLFWGERLISPGLAGIINGSVPIWTYLFSLCFLPQLTPFSFIKASGLLIAIMGIFILFKPILVFNTHASSLMGAAAVLIMAFSYAIGNLLNQYFLAGKIKIEFFTNIYYQHWASVIFLFCLSLLLEHWPTTLHALSLSPTAWFASLYLGVFSTAIAYLIYYHLIRTWDAVRASSVLYIIPILTLGWDKLIYGTPPLGSEIKGVIAILIGVVLIQLSNFKVKPPLLFNRKV